MKIHMAPPFALPQQPLKSDCLSARSLGRVRLGVRGLYFVAFSGTLCLPYEGVARAWLRQEEVKANLCCGRANFDQFFLVVEDGQGTVRKANILSKLLGEQALAHMVQANPAVVIGYPRAAQSPPQV